MAFWRNGSLCISVMTWGWDVVVAEEKEWQELGTSCKDSHHKTDRVVTCTHCMMSDALGSSAWTFQHPHKGLVSRTLHETNWFYNNLGWISDLIFLSSSMEKWHWRMWEEIVDYKRGSLPALVTSFSEHRVVDTIAVCSISIGEQLPLFGSRSQKLLVLCSVNLSNLTSSACVPCRDPFALLRRLPFSFRPELWIRNHRSPLQPIVLVPPPPTVTNSCSKAKAATHHQRLFEKIQKKIQKMFSGKKKKKKKKKKPKTLR